MVIGGVDEGRTGMRVGGERRLTIPRALADGDTPPGAGIGRNDTLVFIADLVQVGPS